MTRRARWAFRVASHAEAGAGHVMRCLALAERMAGPVTFHIDDSALWGPRLDDMQFGWRLEQAPGRVHALNAALTQGEADAVLFDGYDYDRATVARIAARAFTAEIMDGEGASAAAFVLRPGFAADPDHVLLGQGYEDVHTRALARPASTEVHRLLVSFGARDSGDLTGAALAALAECRDRPEIAVVLGASAPHIDAVRTIARRMGGVEVLVDVADMIEVYESSDLAVGAAGQSLPERMCCGLPSIVMTQADNQEPNARAAQVAGAALWVRDAGGLREALAALLSDGGARAAMRAAGLALVDGKGAARAAEALESAVAYRRAPQPS